MTVPSIADMISWTELVIGLTSVVSALVSLIVLIRINLLHKEVNSRLSELVAIARKEGRLAGILEEQERKA